jgi:HK97 family phage prohead protease
MNRAYSTIQIKAMSEDGGKRRFSGVASTPSTDRMGDVIEPKGMKISKDTPLLWQHDSRDPIGWVRSAKVTDAGIEVECEVASVDEDGPLKDRLTNAWQMLKSKLVRGLSIGFNAVESARIEGTYGYRFIKTELLELSAVTIPANSDCSIHTIKSIDRRDLAALGREGPPIDTRPGASGQQQQAAPGRLFSSPRSQKGKDTMKTVQELREERAVKAARLDEITSAWEQKDYARTDDERAEFDTLEHDIADIDDDIRMARRREIKEAGTRTPADGRSTEGASESRGGSARVPGGMSFAKKQDPDDKFPGQSFARIVQTKAVAFIMGESQVTIAERMFGKSHPSLVRHIKAAVAGGGTGSGEWGAELVGIDNRYTGDFVTYLSGRTGFDQLGLREAPRNVSVKGMDAPAIGYWTGESKAIPASAPSASATDLTSLKIGGKCVISNELAMDSSPGAQLVLRDALADAIALRLDQTFFSATAASAGVSPAGIVNGLSQIPMGGTDAAAFRTFMNAAASGFISANTSSGLILAMGPGTALAMGMLVNALGQSEFPMLTETGGTLLGRKVVVSDNIDPSMIFLINPREIWRIGDDGVDFMISREAMVEQDSAPQGASDTPVASSANLVSMLDTDSLAIRATRRVGYKFRRTQAAAVAWTDTADFNGVTS